MVLGWLGIQVSTLKKSGQLYLYWFLVSSHRVLPAQFFQWSCRELPIGNKPFTRPIDPQSCSAKKKETRPECISLMQQKRLLQLGIIDSLVIQSKVMERARTKKGERGLTHGCINLCGRGRYDRNEDIGRCQNKRRVGFCFPSDHINCNWEGVSLCRNREQGPPSSVVHSFIYLYTAHDHYCILWVLHEDTVLKRIVVIMILLKTYRHHTTRRSSSCLDETLSTFMVYLSTEIDSISFFEFHTYAAISGGHFVGFYYYDSSTSAQAIHINPQSRIRC